MSLGNTNSSDNLRKTYLRVLEMAACRSCLKRLTAEQDPLSAMVCHARSKRDRWELGQVVDLVSPRLARLARQKCWPDEDAIDDVQSNSYIALMNKLDQFDCSRPFWPWFRAILLNRIVDYMRSRKRLPLAGMPPSELSKNTSGAVAVIEDVLGPIGMRPVENAIANELEELWKAAVRKLPLEFQEVVTLRRENWSGQEIAAALGEPLGTIHSRISRANASIRAHIYANWPQT